MFESLAKIEIEINYKQPNSEKKIGVIQTERFVHKGQVIDSSDVLDNIPTCCRKTKLNETTKRLISVK